MLRSTRIFLDRKEHRRDRRYTAPAIAVSFPVGDVTARNWSLGGLLLAAIPGVEVGSRHRGRLHIDGQERSFDVLAEVLRQDHTTGGLGCRFVEPSADMVKALDGALMARLVARRTPREKALGAAVLAAAAFWAASAYAAVTTPLPAGGGTLVPGGAPLPQFRLNFPDLLSAAPAVSGAAEDLQISLTSPDRSVLHFLFSPRSQFMVNTDRDTGTRSSYAGLSWSLFDTDGFYGNLGLAGSYTRFGAEEMYRRYLGPPLALHQTFELGYELGGPHSLWLSVDHATTPDFLNDRSELNNFRLNYGLKF